MLGALALFTAFCIPATQATLRDPLYLAILLTVLLAGAVFVCPTCLTKGKDGSAGTDQSGQTDGKSAETADRAGIFIPAVMISGIFVKLCYILYTHVAQRQHDVVDFHVGEGQAAYIEYFVSHLRLPDFDPRSIWGFFQPPLHHILSGIWMRINLFLGLSERQAQENVQVLTFFYMGALMLLTYEICRELKMNERASCIAVSIVSLHPIFILLSGSINNDALSLVLMVFALYLAIVWYKRPKVITIVLLALSIGFAMFAKLSGGLIAPAVAALFLHKLIKEKDARLKIFLQYVVFGVICVPVGLFWTVRNKLLYDMPLNYIPGVGQQFENVTFADRFFDFHMGTVFPAMIENGADYYEHNIFLALMKTSLFGEYDYSQQWGGFTVPAVLLFVSALILAGLALFATVMLLLPKDTRLKSEWKWLFGVLYVTVVGSYLSFALSYSNFSAQDFRYGAIAIVAEALLLGIYAGNTDPAGKKEKCLFHITAGATAVFGACSFMIYFLLGLF
ncbi:MAG: glycosyltransferase family 39 protein [Lachnospiraceae bacterium]|nr:glycosyltransferase family 39 protein [Lachnospiraceae bacterium]